MDHSIQPQGKQHREQQQTGVDQELTATGDKDNILIDTNIPQQFEILKEGKIG